MVKLCAWPSARMGTKGVTSRKYVGRSRAPYEVIGLKINQSQRVTVTLLWSKKSTIQSESKY